MGHRHSPEDGVGSWPSDQDGRKKTEDVKKDTGLGDLSSTPTGRPHEDRYFGPPMPPAEDLFKKKP